MSNLPPNEQKYISIKARMNKGKRVSKPDWSFVMAYNSMRRKISGLRISRFSNMNSRRSGSGGSLKGTAKFYNP